MSRLPAVLLLLASAFGCGPVEETRWLPPQVRNIVAREWPPLGPDDFVTVDVFDPDADLSRVEARFRETPEQPASGSSTHVRFTGRELGEGFGTLTIAARDWGGLTDSWAVRNLVVDLTPPVVSELAAPAVSVDEDVEVRIGDAWALGGVRVLAGGTTLLSQEFGGRGSGLGLMWDETLVRVPAATLGPGTHELVVIATDAARNETRRALEVVVDAGTPSAELRAWVDPTDPDQLLVVATAVDDRPGLRLDLLADGTWLASGLGTRSEWILDLRSFAVGAHALTVLVTDAVGNASESAPLPIEVAR